jgi:hypothetical protein
VSQLQEKKVQSSCNADIQAFGSSQRRRRRWQRFGSGGGGGIGLLGRACSAAAEQCPMFSARLRDNVTFREIYRGSSLAWCFNMEVREILTLS